MRRSHHLDQLDQFDFDQLDFDYLDFDHLDHDDHLSLQRQLYLVLQWVRVD